jgi:prevent-host-death family protein
MKFVSLAEAQARLSAYVEQCETEGLIIVTRNGKVVAVLLAPRDPDDLERIVLARSPGFQALLNDSRDSINRGKGLSRDAFWKAVQRERARLDGIRTEEFNQA